jgi:hypothetical protein
VPLPNAIVFPSGDQTGFDAPFGRSVKPRGSPPDIGSSQIWGRSFSPADLRNASVFESGDQRGEVSRGPSVTRRGSTPPAEGTTQTLVSYRSSASLTVTST